MIPASGRRSPGQIEYGSVDGVRVDRRPQLLEAERERGQLAHEPRLAHTSVGNYLNRLQLPQASSLDRRTQTSRSAWRPTIGISSSWATWRRPVGSPT